MARHLARSSESRRDRQGGCRFTAPGITWPWSSSSPRAASTPSANRHAQVVHAGHQRGGGLIAGTRISAVEEVSLVAMRRRIRQLVTIGRPDGSELMAVSREIVNGSRLE